MMHRELIDVDPPAQSERCRERERCDGEHVCPVSCADVFPVPCLKPSERPLTVEPGDPQYCQMNADGEQEQEPGDEHVHRRAREGVAPTSDRIDTLRTLPSDETPDRRHDPRRATGRRNHCPALEEPVRAVYRAGE